ncbi:MAG: hypothetical protein ACP5C4_09030 [Methanomicrobiales archaeon]
MRLIPGILTLLIAVWACSVPAAAVLSEYTVTGVVEEVRPSENVIVLSADSTIGYSYTEDTPRMLYEPMETPVMLEFAPPDRSAFDIVSAGDTAAVTMLGGLEGSCIAVGRLAQTPEGELVITDLVGDPRAMPVDLVGHYYLSYEAIPDCTNITGTTAPARAVNVTLFSEEWEVWDARLAPGDSMTWNGRNDGSVFEATFTSGEADSSLCPGTEVMVGPQPVSTFDIRITPPIGLTLADAKPATATPTGTASPTATTTPASPGLLAVTALAALAGALVILRRT